MHLAVAGVLNAVWDLWGKILGLPVWQIVCEMSPEEIIRCIDFRYITDVITPDEAIGMLQKTAKGKEERLKEAFNNVAVPAYKISAGWMAFSGDRMKEVLHETLAQGCKVFKFKVGTNIEADRERLSAVWSVPEAIEYMKHLVEFKPVFIEEPINPDDVLGYVAICKVLKPYGAGIATGEAA
ncbi:mitochondrial enolase superfamily member 1 [Fusarium circinatum]|uniref:Mitochondrial enolase superfamily member 1 n=1 Tax=Fusarium circinatum TaxID=48490 RepID=A0A8H5WEX2_FUSCI|nr:mitochondrial enolase superfamily member 1 [Fusarium circinatum]